MLSNKLTPMFSNKLLYFALTTSVLLNCGCIALVGEAASRHSAPHPPRSVTSLHPAALQMAADPQVTGPQDAAGKPDGGSGGSGGSGFRRGLGASQAAGGEADQSHPSPADPSRTSSAGAAGTAEAELVRQNANLEARAANLEVRLERQLSSGRPLSFIQQQTLARLRQQAAQMQIAQMQIAQMQTSAQQTALSRLNQKQLASARGMTGQPETALSRQLSALTHPRVSSRGSHTMSFGSSITPKPITYPKMAVDLGTIHETRPKYGITGGGSSDQRQVSIKVHYVVDDPNNVPKTLKPNRTIKRFASNCKGDPGNKSRCLPTGGNTSLGGTTLHGKHDQITGVKYCVPGSGGIGVGGGSSQSRPSSPGTAGRSGTERAGRGKDYGKLAGSSRSLSQPYRGRGLAYPIPVNGWHGGHPNPNEVMATTIHASHLPARASDYRGLVPGAAVPVPDRKWVSDPQAHLAAALPGPLAVPVPRFRVSPRSIGSFSRFGTINWGHPIKTPRRKQPLGGDGTGLLGKYYRGNNFQTLAFTRPDRNIDFDWSAAPPDPRFGRTEEYSVRWLGNLVPQATDTYTLMASSDDGVRVYLDGKLLVSDWSTHGPSEDTATVRLVAGHKYAMKIEYFENGYGLAVMKLYWESPHVPREYLPEQDLRYPK